MGFSLVAEGLLRAHWLIALMVWLLPLAETARVVVIVQVRRRLGGFSHTIAGSTDALYGVLVGAASPTPGSRRRSPTRRHRRGATPPRSRASAPSRRHTAAP